ncbi:ATP-binding protein [Methylobacillus arboreus]|uniref:ATP-binding protein n=1 Tax=Methylobacillus arboreus TaxID=755170 RepID=UPI001E3C7DCC|nr:ATP-binding protein [Methylobacillus arboreus]MCB5190430.1 ATP-binding protein [Methylobacillus arboreus]
MADIEQLITRAEAVLARLESFLPPPASAPDWNAVAWRWQTVNGRGHLVAVDHPHHISLDDIRNVDEQKAEIVRNTEQFVHGYPANNVLLTGARGTGKSSLVKAVLSAFADQGLRLVEVDKQDLVALPEIAALLRERKERFIVFCDDLSFEASDPGYKALKVVLDGSIAATSDNVLVYATSNRRHLMPEYMSENLEVQRHGDEIRPGDTTEEKVSLSERFGLWLSFYSFSQDEYLAVAAQWLKHYGVAEMNDEIGSAALLFSHTRGARSGRVAYQFARDYVGRLALTESKQP